jgi:hypothetical protein
MLARSPAFAQSIREFWQSKAPPAAPLFFLVFIVVGAAFVVFAKFSELPNWFVALVPVAIMLVYAGLALFARFIRLRDDQTGDNLYYMGFIFTLTSLAVALYQFEPDIGFDVIVRNFGVAISSTITGIALRVIFNQMRQDPIEVEHSARQELAEASRNVRQQLDETVLAFSHFRTQTIQSLEEVRDELRRRTLSEHDNFAEHTARPIQDGAAKTGVALQVFASAIDTLGAKLASIQAPERIIEVTLEPLVETLAATVTEFSKHSQQQSAALIEAVGALAEPRAVKARFRWRLWLLLGFLVALVVGIAGWQMYGWPVSSSWGLGFNQ